MHSRLLQLTCYINYLLNNYLLDNYLVENMKTKNNKWITNELKMKCKTGIARNKMQKKSASNTEAMHLSEAGFRCADDMKVSRHNL